MTDLLVRLFVRNYAEFQDAAVRRRYGNLGGMVGIFCNLLLCGMKLTVGLLTGGISLVADGLNNLSDMGSSVVTMVGFRLSNKPADSDHPFGHGRFEYLSALFVAVLILFVGAELLIESVKTLIAGTPAPDYSAGAVLCLAVSVAVKLWMFLFNRKIGKKIQSEALLATAQDSVNDCIATTAILLSVLLAMWIRLPFNLDAVMAAGVALFILYSGIQSARHTVGELLGGPPAPELIHEIETTVLSFEGFVGIHDLMVHNYGPGRQFASVHVEVPQDVDIVACHERIDLCEKLVNERTGVQLVIHMDPIDVHNESVQAVRRALSEKLSEIDSRLSLHDFRMTPAGEARTNLIFDVVLPAAVPYTPAQLQEKISAAATQLNGTYVCVIAFDRDYSGR